MSENKSVSGYHLGYLLLNEKAAQKALKDINTLIDMYKNKKIKINVDSEYPFSKISEAMKRMHSRQNVGKIILKPDCEFPELAVTSESQVKITTTVEKQEEKKPTTKKEEKVVEEKKCVKEKEVGIGFVVLKVMI